MEERISAELAEHFSSLKDPRMHTKIRHKLIDIITITLCAAVCGAETWNQISVIPENKIQLAQEFFLNCQMV